MPPLESCFNAKPLVQGLAPFPFFVIPRFLETGLAQDLLTWIDGFENWRREDHDIYESDSFHLSENDVLESPLSAIATGESKKRLVSELSDLFGEPIGSKVTFTIVRHRPGDGVSPHTDYWPENERDHRFFTHRLVIYLNNGWTPANGGTLGLLGEGNEGPSLGIAISPQHNTAIGLTMGKSSFHCVSPIQSGCRYSLVLSLLHASGRYAEEVVEK